MSWNPKDFSEYDESSNEIDYADPAFYRQDTSRTPRSTQPVQRLEPSPEESPGGYAYDPELMTPYHGPSHIEGYTTDIGAEQREAAKRGDSDGGRKRKGLAGLGGIGAALSALLLKFPLLASFLKVGWLGFSALFSVVVYSLIFGWPFAIGLVVLLFIHEMGHAIVMKLKGIPIGGMIFIPFLGAAGFLRPIPQKPRAEKKSGFSPPLSSAPS